MAWILKRTEAISLRSCNVKVGKILVLPIGSVHRHYVHNKSSWSASSFTLQFNMRVCWLYYGHCIMHHHRSDLHIHCGLPLWQIEEKKQSARHSKSSRSIPGGLRQGNGTSYAKREWAGSSSGYLGVSQAALEESCEKILQENSECVKTVTTYAAMDLVQFGFPTEAYAFIQSKVCTLVETGG